MGATPLDGGAESGNGAESAAEAQQLPMADEICASALGGDIDGDGFDGTLHTRLMAKLSSPYSSG